MLCRSRSVLMATGPDRDKAITRFNEDSKTRILLSSDAGAYGVDLPSGSHVINYDLPWSAGCSGPAHRPHRPDQQRL